jgi:hypothetical protein
MRWTFLLAALLVFIMFIPALASLYAEYLWFGEVAYVSVFLTILKTKLMLGALGVAVFFLIALLNFKKAAENAPGNSSFSRFVPIAALAFAIFMGFATSFGWEVFLRFINQVPFGSADPILTKT